jgi:hypothetical protein
MKTQKLESLLGGLASSNVSPDAMIGLHSLSRRLAEKDEEDELFEVAMRRANDEELRKLARFRLETEKSKFLD